MRLTLRGPCEVRHVGVAGGNGDGGIDLYLIREEEEWLVQVKRRLTDNPEPIESIRLLNGVLLREGKHKRTVGNQRSAVFTQRLKRNKDRYTRALSGPVNNGGRCRQNDRESKPHTLGEGIFKTCPGRIAVESPFRVSGANLAG